MATPSTEQPRRRAAVQRPRDARRARGRLLDALRLRAAVLSQPRRGRRALRPRACDAKGILAAQLAAAERLRRRGERRVGLLFVVGEERGSDGAAVANATAAARDSWSTASRPTTGSRTATRGVLRVQAARDGRAAHSAAPEQGESAIEKLIDALVRLRALPLPADPELGTTYYTVGLIEGGVAPNVIPPHASAPK